jgi:hypothetical protein
MPANNANPVRHRVGRAWSAAVRLQADRRIHELDLYAL